MKLSNFDFKLPDSLIAQYPKKNRSDSRLLIFNNNKITDSKFSNILDYLKPNDLLIFNNTKVIKARLFGKKQTGGKVEVMLERILDNNIAIAMIKANSKLEKNSVIILENNIKIKVLKKKNSVYKILFLTNQAINKILEDIGHVPLPPYIKRKTNSKDVKNYQTIFAQKEGAVAAPTAGLHFDSTTLNKFKRKSIDYAFITLHIGMGTFSPIRVDNIKDHKMHKEYYEIDDVTLRKIAKTNKNNGRIIAVGTTSVRALESAFKSKKYQAETNIFITPGFKFKVVDMMVTNFHLPKSSLIILISAFIGIENTLKIYNHAIKNKYRFYSYGDVMLINPN